MKIETIEAAGAELANPSCHVERAPLLAALEFACRIVERRNTIPILSNVMLSAADDGALRIMATDLDVQAVLTVAAAWTVPGAFTVPAASLRDIVKKSPAGAQITLSVENERLTVSAGRARNTLAILPVDDFPVIAGPGEDAARFAIPSDQFARDLAAVAPAMSKEETRYYLNGAALQLRDDRLILVATDGPNLASVTRDVPEGAETLPDIILPRKLVDIIGRALKKAEPHPLSVETDCRKVTIGGAGFTLTAKLIDGTFPNWQAAMEKALGVDGLQSVAMLELDPRLNAGAIAKLGAAVGTPLSVETGEAAACLTAPGFPEYLGLSMFMREDKAPKGFGPNEYACADEHALSYLDELRERRELPALECGHVIHGAGGLVMGATYGQSEYIRGEDVEITDWETLTTRFEHREGYVSFEDGAYSVPMPRSHQALVSVEIVGDDGAASFHHLRTNKAGALELSKEAVRTLCGNVDGAARVEIPAMQCLHGEIVTGYGFPAVPTISTGKTNGRRQRPMTDREQMDAYCADPAGFMDRIRARPIGTPGPCATPEEIADSDRRVAEREELHETMRAVRNVAAMIGMLCEPIAPEISAVAHETEAPGPDAPRDPETSPSGPEIGPDEAAPDMAAIVAGLVVRVAALEAERTPPTMEKPDTPLSREYEPRPRRSAARERLLRRYLAMRVERERLRRDRDAAWSKHSEACQRVRQAEAAQEATWESRERAVAAAGRYCEAKRRLARRGLEMRQRAALDRAALIAASRFVREAPQHPNAPAPDIVGQLHRERDAAAGRIEAAETRAAALERANARLADEVERLSGRAIRAEQALQTYRVAPPPPFPALTYAPAGEADMGAGE